MKKLLIISYAFPPQHNPASIFFAKILTGLRKTKSPFLPVVICADPQTTLEEQDHSLIRLLPVPLVLEKLPSTEATGLHRLTMIVFPFLKRLPDKSFWWVRENRRRIITLCQRHTPAVIYSRSHYLGSHLLALKAKQETGTPWVAHFSDPWTTNPYVKYGILTHFLNRRWERQVIEFADRIIFVSAALRDSVMQGYPASWQSKCSVIPQPFDPKWYPPIQKAKRDAKRDRFTFSCIGNFYGKRNPVPLLKALSVLQKQHPDVYREVQVQFIGHIPRRQLLHPLFRRHAARIHHIGPVSYLESLKYMKNADALVLIDADITPSVFLPSKLIDYIGTQNPILGITPQDSPADLLIRKLRNLSHPPREIQPIAESCVQLFFASKRKDNPFRYTSHAIHDYHIDTVARLLRNELESVIDNMISDGRKK